MQQRTPGDWNGIQCADSRRAVALSWQAGVDASTAACHSSYCRVRVSTLMLTQGLHGFYGLESGQSTRSARTVVCEVAV